MEHDAEFLKAVNKCIDEVMKDKPTKETRWQLYLWHRRWRKMEYDLFSMGGMWASLQWCVCKEALNRIGGFW